MWGRDSNLMGNYSSVNVKEGGVVVRETVQVEEVEDPVRGWRGAITLLVNLCLNLGLCESRELDHSNGL